MEAFTQPKILLVGPQPALDRDLFLLLLFSLVLWPSVDNIYCQYGPLCQILIWDSQEVTHPSTELNVA